MSKINTDYLKHILDECDFLITIKSKLKKKKNFLEDETAMRAAVRSLEIIGEASKKIDNELKSKYIDIPWHEMAGMRDKLIHDYMGVNYFIVWDVIENKISPLKNRINNLLEK